MSKQAEQEFVERYNPIDSIESTHYERARAVEYGGIEADGEYTYSDVRLEALGRKWMAEQENTLRSARSRAEAAKIAELIVFELAYRTGQLKKLEEALAWEEHEND